MPSPTTLAVIDMQNVFADDGSPWRTPRFPEVVGPVRGLAERFGEATVYTRFVAPEQPAGSWRPYYEAWPFALQPADAPLWDVVPALAGMPGRTVSAPTFSKWSRLAGIVPAGGRLVLCGVSTDCCVLSTALEAADAGIEVIVVGEAKALDIMRLYAPLVQVVDLATGLALADAVR
jgi:nicotinamidase-related amidase